MSCLDVIKDYYLSLRPRLRVLVPVCTVTITLYNLPLTLYVNFLGNSLDDKTSAKNINVHLTAQAHQWSLIVGMSRFAQEKQLKV